MTERLTPLDGTFLELEDADHAAHMHIGAILVFGPRPQTANPGLDEVRARIEGRLDALPRYRQRLAAPTAGSLDWQHWVGDECFEISRHVMAGTLRAPGGWEQMLEWAGEYFSRRLSRDVPLWEVVLVDGLADGHWALVTKTHHCLVDGIGSLDSALLLVDGIETTLPPCDEEAPHLPEWMTPARPPLHALGAGLRAAAHPLRTAGRAAALGEMLVKEELHGAPEVSINEPIGAGRTLRAAELDLDEAKLIKRRLGGTVNDVILAGVCSGLRALLNGRGETLPDAGVRAMVPLNVRSEDERAKLGNRISSLFVDLPVSESGALARYERIRAGTAAVKASHEPEGADALLDVTKLAPPLIHQLLSKSLFAKRLFNLTVTNVAGPPEPLTVLGSRLERIWPLVPLAADHGLGVAVVSYAGDLMIGINADRDTVSDVDVFAEGMTVGLRELQRIAHTADAALAAG